MIITISVVAISRRSPNSRVISDIAAFFILELRPGNSVNSIIVNFSVLRQCLLLEILLIGHDKRMNNGLKSAFV